MPPLRQSRGPMPRNYRPVDPQPQAAPQRTPVPNQNRQQPNALMHAPMPIVASTNDAFTRQFYGVESNLPQHRILPIGGKL